MTPSNVPTGACANHIFRKAHVRCNKCYRPMCLTCVERTPVGYRCKQCIQKHQYTFETIEPQDYKSAVRTSATTSVLASVVLVSLPVFVVFAPFIGAIIAERVHRTVQRRHGRYLPWVAVGGTCLGGLAAFAVSFLCVRLGIIGLNNWVGVLIFLWPIVYMLGCSVGVYRRLKQLEKL